MLHEDVDNRLRVSDKIIGVKLELLELGILANEVFDRVFKGFHDFGQFRSIGRSLDVEDDFVLNSQFLGDRQGIV